MSETDSMVERVALVLYGERMRVWKAVAPAELLDRAVKWEGESDSYREQVRREARLSIKAMREPTDDMLRACWTNHHPWRENAPPPEDRQMPFNEMCEQVKADWQDMIDAALNPPANT